MTDSFMFSIIETKPDIIFAISIISRFAKNLRHRYTKVVKTILRYLKGSREYKITYSVQSELLVEEYSDSDWAGGKETRKSILSFIFILNRSPVSWYSKRQSTVALFSTKTEYITLTLTAKEATWLHLLLIELGLLQSDK